MTGNQVGTECKSRLEMKRAETGQIQWDQRGTDGLMISHGLDVWEPDTQMDVMVRDMDQLIKDDLKVSSLGYYDDRVPQAL